MMLQNSYEMFCTVLHPVQTDVYVCKGETLANQFLEQIIGVPSVTMPTSLDSSTLSSWRL
jgi:hypothetical protein